MMKKKVFILNIVFLLAIITASVLAYGAEDVGQVVAVKGKALIERDTKRIDAVLKEKIYQKDIVETMEASRLKMLFRDDSILTLGEKSRVIVKDYLSAERGERGKSVYNLVEGKLRSLVGGNEFEIHTPTVVVAARGTYFITWAATEEGIPVSGVFVLEGIVEIRNINPAIPGVVRLERGTMSKVFENKPPTPAMPIPTQLMNDLIDATELRSMPEVEKKPLIEEKPVVTAPSLIGDEVSIRKDTLPMIPPIDNQAPLRGIEKTPVDVNLQWPD